MPSTTPAACVASSSIDAWLITCWQKCFEVRSAVHLSSADDGWSCTLLWASCRTEALAEMLTESLPMYLIEYMAVALDAEPAPRVSGTALPAVHAAITGFQSAMMPFRQTKLGDPHSASRRRSLSPPPSSSRTARVTLSWSRPSSSRSSGARSPRSCSTSGVTSPALSASLTACSSRARCAPSSSRPHSSRRRCLMRRMHVATCRASCLISSSFWRCARNSGRCSSS